METNRRQVSERKIQIARYRTHNCSCSGKFQTSLLDRNTDFRVGEPGIDSSPSRIVPFDLIPRRNDHDKKASWRHKRRRRANQSGIQGVAPRDVGEDDDIERMTLVSIRKVKQFKTEISGLGLVTTSPIQGNNFLRRIESLYNRFPEVAAKRKGRGGNPSPPS